MAATDQLKFFCGRKNSKTQSEIIQILLSHSPPYGDVQVIFKVLMKFKMATIAELKNRSQK